MSSKPRRRVTVDDNKPLSESSDANKKKPSVFERLGPGAPPRKGFTQPEQSSSSGGERYEMKMQTVCKRFLKNGNCPYKGCPHSHPQKRETEDLRHKVSRRREPVPSEESEEESEVETKRKSREKPRHKRANRSHEKESKMKSTVVLTKKNMPEITESESEDPEPSDDDTPKEYLSELELERKRQAILAELAGEESPTPQENFVISRQLRGISQSRSESESSSESPPPPKVDKRGRAPPAPDNSKRSKIEFSWKRSMTKEIKKRTKNVSPVKTKPRRVSPPQQRGREKDNRRSDDRPHKKRPVTESSSEEEEEEEDSSPEPPPDKNRRRPQPARQRKKSTSPSEESDDSPVEQRRKSPAYDHRKKSPDKKRKTSLPPREKISRERDNIRDKRQEKGGAREWDRDRDSERETDRGRERTRGREKERAEPPRKQLAELPVKKHGRSVSRHAASPEVSPKPDKRNRLQSPQYDKKSHSQKRSLTPDNKRPQRLSKERKQQTHEPEPKSKRMLSPRDKPKKHLGEHKRSRTPEPPERGRSADSKGRKNEHKPQRQVSPHEARKGNSRHESPEAGRHMSADSRNRRDNKDRENRDTKDREGREQRPARENNRDQRESQRDNYKDGSREPRTNRDAREQKDVKGRLKDGRDRGEDIHDQRERDNKERDDRDAGRARDQKGGRIKDSREAPGREAPGREAPGREAPENRDKRRAKDDWPQSREERRSPADVQKRLAQLAGDLLPNDKVSPEPLMARERKRPALAPRDARARPGEEDREPPKRGRGAEADKSTRNISPVPPRSGNRRQERSPEPLKGRSSSLDGRKGKDTKERGRVPPPREDNLRDGRPPKDKERSDSRGPVERRPEKGSAQGSDRGSDRGPGMDRARLGDRDRDPIKDRGPEKDRVADRDRGVERVRGPNRDRVPERDRNADREKAPDRERNTDRDKVPERDRNLDKDRGADRDRGPDKDRDRDMVPERNRTIDRDRIRDVGHERDRGPDRERVVPRDDKDGRPRDNKERDDRGNARGPDKGKDRERGDRGNLEQGRTPPPGPRRRGERSPDPPRGRRQNDTRSKGPNRSPQRHEEFEGNQIHPENRLGPPRPPDLMSVEIPVPGPGRLLDADFLQDDFLDRPRREDRFNRDRFRDNFDLSQDYDRHDMDGDIIGGQRELWDEDEDWEKGGMGGRRRPGRGRRGREDGRARRGGRGRGDGRRGGRDDHYRYDDEQYLDESLPLPEDWVMWDGDDRHPGDRRRDDIGRHMDDGRPDDLDRGRGRMFRDDRPEDRNRNKRMYDDERGLSPPPKRREMSPAGSQHSSLRENREHIDGPRERELRRDGGDRSTRDRRERSLERGLDSKGAARDRSGPRGRGGEVPPLSEHELGDHVEKSRDKRPTDRARPRGRGDRPPREDGKRPLSPSPGRPNDRKRPRIAADKDFDAGINHGDDGAFSDWSEPREDMIGREGDDEVGLRPFHDLDRDQGHRSPSRSSLGSRKSRRVGDDYRHDDLRVGRIDDLPRHGPNDTWSNPDEEWGEGAGLIHRGPGLQGEPHSPLEVASTPPWEKAARRRNRIQASGSEGGDWERADRPPPPPLGSFGQAEAAVRAMDGGRPGELTPVPASLPPPVKTTDGIPSLLDTPVIPPPKPKTEALAASEPPTHAPEKSSKKGELYDEISDDDLDDLIENAEADPETQNGKTGVCDVLDIDWTNLVSESLPKPAKSSSALKRFSAANIFSQLGVSRTYAGEALITRLRSVCQKQLEAEVQEEAGDATPPPAPQFELLHDVAAMHAVETKRRKERANILRNIGPYRRALCARRDLTLRRYLCRLDQESDAVGMFAAPIIDNDLYRQSLQFLRQGSTERKFASSPTEVEPMSS